jgi:hypothetical protein
MLGVERLQLDPTAIRRHALRFDTSFTDELVRVVEDDLGIPHWRPSAFVPPVSARRRPCADA